MTVKAAPREMTSSSLSPPYSSSYTTAETESGINGNSDNCHNVIVRERERDHSAGFVNLTFGI